MLLLLLPRKHTLLPSGLEERRIQTATIPSSLPSRVREGVREDSVQTPKMARRERRVVRAAAGVEARLREAQGEQEMAEEKEVTEGLDGAQQDSLVREEAEGRRRLGQMVLRLEAVREVLVLQTRLLAVCFQSLPLQIQTIRRGEEEEGAFLEQ